MSASAISFQTQKLYPGVLDFNRKTAASQNTHQGKKPNRTLLEHFHPIAFVQHLKRIFGTGITWPLKTNIIRKKLKNHTFGWVRKYEDGTPKIHQGWDFEATPGTPIYAIAGGVIEYVRTKDTPKKGYGLQIILSFQFEDKTYYAFYGHLKSIDVKKGEEVKMEQKIGTSGNSGNAWNMKGSNQHLHFEIRTKLACGKGEDGRIDPIKVFKECPLKEAIDQ